MGWKVWGVALYGVVAVVVIGIAVFGATVIGFSANPLLGAVFGVFGLILETWVVLEFAQELGFDPELPDPRNWHPTAIYLSTFVFCIILGLGIIIGIQLAAAPPGASGLGGYGGEGGQQGEITDRPSPTPTPTASPSATPSPTPTPTATPTPRDSDDDGVPDEKERELGTDPNDDDTDGDRLDDGEELLHETDPTDPDTDNDRLTDFVELNGEHFKLPNADPLRKDVFVEVDTVGGCFYSNLNTEGITESFAEAPVENPDGSEGITLHLRHSERLEDTESTLTFGTNPDARNDINYYYKNHFNHSLGGGYHYAVIAPDVRGERPVAGSAVRGVSATQCTKIKTSLPRIFMHELGHSLGLNDDEYDKIDTSSIPEDYPSVMNYHGSVSGLDYADSSEDGWSDWEFLEEKMYAPAGYRTVGLSEYPEYERGI